MPDRVTVVPQNLRSLFTAIGNSSIGAIFGHKGYELKRPRFGTLQLGWNVLTKSGIIKAEVVSEAVHLGDHVIVYIDTSNRSEDSISNP